MAFANFFDKTATAASQVLSNFNLDEFKAKLSTHVVGVYFDNNAVECPEGQATLDLTIRLLSRLYPTLAIHAVGSAAADQAKKLKRLARSINDQVEFEPDLSLATAILVVGNTTPDIGPAPIYIGSNEWRARLSVKGPVGSGKSENPFGGGAAACFGAANVFRTVFADQLVNGALDSTIDLSMLSYTHGATTDVPLPTDCNLGGAYLVGLGAIGNGALWAFARVPGLAGTLHLVDHETVDLSNLQRYVMTTQKDIDRPKVELGRRVLKRQHLKVLQHQKTWGDFVEDRLPRSFERVAVALDTAEDRISLQASLPKWIVNAWTQALDLGVSRHSFDDGNACLACLYLPDRKAKDEDEKVAEELRMPEATREVRGLLQTGHGVSPEFVQRVATAFSVPFAELETFVGQPLRSFYQKAVCGGVMMRLTGGDATGTAVVPMAFQSALAGILLAADLVKSAADLPVAPTTITRINLLRPLAQYLGDPRSKSASRRCICCDDDFLAVYRQKYAKRS